MKGKNTTDWDKTTRKIFVILFENTKTFFVNDTTQKNDWKVYDEHYRQRHGATREQFALCKKEGILPSMFLLSVVEGTVSDAFQRKIEWSKYFLEHGYSCLAGQKMMGILRDFDADSSDFYSTIKDLPIREICAPEKNLFPEFRNSSKRKRTKNSRLQPNEYRIELIVKEKEYLKYKKTAEDYGVPLSEYVMDCVRLGGVFQVDTSFMEQYIRSINDCHNLFSGMLVTYLLSREYYPADIVKMEEVGKEIARSNTQVKNEIIRLCRQLKRLKNAEQLNTDPLK